MEDKIIEVDFINKELKDSSYIEVDEEHGTTFEHEDLTPLMDFLHTWTVSIDCSNMNKEKQ